jgi:putative acetyltransferase
MIRKATMQDVPRIAEIIVFGKRVAYRPIFNNDVVSFNELQVINVIEEYRNNPTLVDNMLVYDDGIVKGVINRVFEEDTVEISEFYVEPFFKGNGIGKELIQQVIFEARMSKRNRIFLWVIEDNLSARKFYENNGFIASGQTCLIEGTTKTDMCYELII